MPIYWHYLGRVSGLSDWGGALRSESLKPFYHVHSLLPYMGCYSLTSWLVSPHINMNLVNTPLLYNGFQNHWHHQTKINFSFLKLLLVNILSHWHDNHNWWNKSLSLSCYIWLKNLFLLHNTYCLVSVSHRMLSHLSMYLQYLETFILKGKISVFSKLYQSQLSNLFWWVILPCDILLLFYYHEQDL